MLEHSAGDVEMGGGVGEIPAGHGPAARVKLESSAAKRLQKCVVKVGGEPIPFADRRLELDLGIVPPMDFPRGPGRLDGHATPQ